MSCLISLKCRNENGQAILLGVIGLTLLLVGVATAHFIQTTNAALVLRTENKNNMALFNAQRGLEYVVYELAFAAPEPINWFTHQAQSDQSLVYAEGNFFAEYGIQLGNINEIYYDADNPQDSGYRSKLDQEVQFIAKIYNDPSNILNQANKIILVKGISGDTQRMIASRVDLTSLYEYFIFDPNSGRSIRGNLDAGGGRIHINGDVTLFGNAQIFNLGELNVNGYFIYDSIRFYVPMYDTTAIPAGEVGGPAAGVTGMFVDDQYRTLAPRFDDGLPGTVTWAQMQGIDDADGNPNWKVGACSGMSDESQCAFSDLSGPQKYYSLEKLIYHANPFTGSGIGTLQGDRWGSVCEKGNTGVFSGCGSTYGREEDGHIWEFRHPHLYPDSYMYKNYGQSDEMVAPTKIQPVGGGSLIPIPNRLNTSYRWDKYYFDGSQGRSRMYDGERYAYPPPGTYDPQTQCPEPYCADVQYLNTELQAQDWIDFLRYDNDNDGDGIGDLYGVIKDRNTGGEPISPPVFDQARYQSTAQNEGIYIRNTVPSDEWNNYEYRGSETALSRVNTYYRDPDKTLDNNGSYEVYIKGVSDPLVPDNEGQIKMNIEGDELVLFEKKGFYNTRSTLWTQVIQMNICNLKRAIDAGDLELDENIFYSDWGVALACAEEIIDGGMTVITEGDAFTIGNVNVDTDDPSNLDNPGFEPAAIITDRMFQVLSEDFNYPQELPELGNHPDYDHNFGYVPESVNRQWMHDHDPDNPGDPTVEAVMPNKVRNDVYVNISVLGERATDQDVGWHLGLEMWSWYEDWLNDGEADIHEFETFTRGTRLDLPDGAFESKFDYGGLDISVNRRCDPTCGAIPNGWPSCRGCSNYCDGTDPDNPCPGSSTGVFPIICCGHRSGLLAWENRYLTDGFPPGDLPGLSLEVWYPLPNTEENWTTHCKLLQGNV